MWNISSEFRDSVSSFSPPSSLLKLRNKAEWISVRGIVVLPLLIRCLESNQFIPLGISLQFTLCRLAVLAEVEWVHIMANIRLMHSHTRKVVF